MADPVPADERPSAERTGPGNGEASSALRRFAAGDATEEAFEAAVPDLARLIRGYLYFARVPRDELEDLAQDAIVRVYTKRSDRTGTTEASLRAWLRTICRNLALNARVRPEPPPPEIDHEHPEDRLDLREALQTCLARLREPDRTVFRLRHVREFTTHEIAELYGWKLRNTEYVLARARESLQRHLRREGYDRAPGEKA